MIFDNSEDEPILVAKKIKDNQDFYLNDIFDHIMIFKIIEPKKEDLSDRFYLAVKKAFANKMEKRRKLGLPIIISRNGKIIDINPRSNVDKTKEKQN